MSIWFIYKYLVFNLIQINKGVAIPNKTTKKVSKNSIILFGNLGGWLIIEIFY